LPQPPKGFHIIYTGVGKVQAAVSLLKEIEKMRPVEVWNYGTAGGLNYTVQGLVQVDNFVQRDMIGEPLAPRGTIPFSTTNGIKTSQSNTQVICGTGDSFVTKPDVWYVTNDIDIVDMEGWALAYVCQQYKIPFRSWKYVSDYANRDAELDWTSNVQKGAELFNNECKKEIPLFYD